jgi:hypothetical protein
VKRNRRWRGVSLGLCGPITTARCHCNPKCLNCLSTTNIQLSLLSRLLLKRTQSETVTSSLCQSRRMRTSAVALSLSLGLVTAGAELQPRQTATIPDFVTKYGEESNH